MVIPFYRYEVLLVLVVITLTLLLPRVTSLAAPSTIQTRKSTLYSKDGAHIIGSLVERRNMRAEVHEVWIQAANEDDKNKNNIPPVNVKIPFVGRSESVGSSIWPPSLAGAILLCSSPTLQAALQGKVILELGSGIGVGGLVAASLSSSSNSGPRSCVLTDNDPELIQRLQDHLDNTMVINNKDNNGDDKEFGCELSARQLDWRDTDINHDNDSNSKNNSQAAPSLYDVCMGFDVAYYYHLKAPLITTVRANLKPQNSLLWVIGQANRESQWQLYHHLHDGGYNQVTDEHEAPWPGTTQMILYRLEMQKWVDVPATEDGEDEKMGPVDETINGPVDGTIPIASLVYTTKGFPLESLTLHDHLASKEDEEAQLMSF